MATGAHSLQLCAQLRRPRPRPRARGPSSLSAAAAIRGLHQASFIWLSLAAASFAAAVLLLQVGGLRASNPPRPRAKCGLGLVRDRTSRHGSNRVCLGAFVGLPAAGHQPQRVSQCAGQKRTQCAAPSWALSYARRTMIVSMTRVTTGTERLVWHY